MEKLPTKLGSRAEEDKVGGVAAEELLVAAHGSALPDTDEEEMAEAQEPFSDEDSTSDEVGDGDVDMVRPGTFCLTRSAR